MVRKSTVLLAALALLVLASTAQAGAGNMRIGFNGGLAVPTGEFGDFWESGPRFGLFGEYNVINQFAIGIDGSWSTSDPTELYQTALDVLSAKSEFTFFQVGAHGKWMIPVQESRVGPYLIGGLGIYRVEEEVTFASLPTTTISQTAFGLRGGGGLSIQATNVLGIFVEGNYHLVLTDEADLITHDKTTFFGAQAGVNFALGSGP